jgi:hypothetical protein
MGRVQDRAQEPEHVLHLVVLASLYQVPIRAVFIPIKVILVLATVFEGPLVPLGTSPRDFRQCVLGDVVQSTPLHILLHLIRDTAILGQLVHHRLVSDSARKIQGPSP